MLFRFSVSKIDAKTMQITFTIVSRIIKINLTKELKELYNEDKTLMREILGTSKSKLLHILGKISSVNSISRFCIILIKVIIECFMNTKTNAKICMVSQITMNSQNNPGGEEFRKLYI